MQYQFVGHWGWPQLKKQQQWKYNTCMCSGEQYRFAPGAKYHHGECEQHTVPNTDLCRHARTLKFRRSSQRRMFSVSVSSFWSVQVILELSACSPWNRFSSCMSGLSIFSTKFKHFFLGIFLLIHVLMFVVA